MSGSESKVSLGYDTLSFVFVLEGIHDLKCPGVSHEEVLVFRYIFRFVCAGVRCRLPHGSDKGEVLAVCRHGAALCLHTSPSPNTDCSI